MAHCLDFWRKWKQEENFCGVGKLQVRKLNKYLALATELKEKYGIDEEQVYTHLSASAVNNTGLSGLVDCPLRKEVLDKIAANITGQKQVRQLDILEWTGIRSWTDDFAKEHLSPLAFRSFKYAGKRNRERAIKRAKLASSDNLQYGRGSDAADFPLEARLDYIRRITSIGQANILKQIIDAGHAKDEYDALCVALAWASEKVAAQTPAPVAEKPPDPQDVIEYGTEFRLEELQFLGQFEDIKVAWKKYKETFPNSRRTYNSIKAKILTHNRQIRAREKREEIPKDGIIVGGKVKQIAGNERAYGVGTVEWIHGNDVRVKFVSSTKILLRDHFEAVDMEKL